MDGQSPRQPVNADVVPRQQGVRSVNLLNCLVFGPGQKGQRGQTLGFRRLVKRSRSGQRASLISLEDWFMVISRFRSRYYSVFRV